MPIKLTYQTFSLLLGLTSQLAQDEGLDNQMRTGITVGVIVFPALLYLPVA